MDNMYPPTGDGDPQDSRPTDQFWTSRPGPASGNPQDPAGPPPQPSYLEQHYSRDRRHALRWTVGLSLALVLAAGGVIAGVALASHPPASRFSQASDSTAAHGATNSGATNGSAANNSAANSSGSSKATAGQPQSQAAALGSVLNAAGTPGTLTLSSAPAAAGGTATPATKAVAAARIRACRRAVAALRAARRTGRPVLIRAARKDVIAHCHGLLRRHRLFRFALLRGVAGQFTFRTRQGTLRTLAFERGVIQSVSGNTIVVRAVNGLTETWDLVGNTVVREHGQKTSTQALTSGEPVWVGGLVISGANDARLIVIRPPSAPPTATPAPSASGS